MAGTRLPTELLPLRDKARAALGKVKPAGTDTRADKKFLFNAERSEASRSLPPYFLVYFLLVDLLGFKNLGRFEKIAWSVPIDFDGKAFLIEHRKFGLGVFQHSVDDEPASVEIARLVRKAVRIARPYFAWRAEEAAAASHLNVLNRSWELHDQFRYFAAAADAKSAEAEARKDEIVQTRVGSGMTIHMPSDALLREARYLRLAALEHFFSWTEHIFIHIAVLRGKATTGTEVANLAGADWAHKYKSAFDLRDPTFKKFYDDLMVLRRHVRNFVAHGSFGKDREAFSFHSGAGAVPMLLGADGDRVTFAFGTGIDFDHEAAMALITRFIEHLWAGPRAPAKIYIQDSSLPLILTYSRNGYYARAMTSVEEMEQFTEMLADDHDRHANMDF